MKRDIFRHLKEHYISVARELSSQARQAGLLTNPTGVGTEREEVYRAFLERHLPKMCDVFLGGYVFDTKGISSAQIDVIITSGSTPRFRMSSGNRYIAPLEGTIGVVEVKSQLNKTTLQEALYNSASIPSMPDSKGIIAPYLKLNEEKWEDLPYKILYAYDGIAVSTICRYLASFYNQHQGIPIARRPNIIHVLEKYMIVRITPGMTVVNPDGRPDSNQPEVGQYKPFLTGSDASAMLWTLIALQENSFLCNSLMYKYGEWHTKIMERIQKESLQ